MIGLRPIAPLVCAACILLTTWGEAQAQAGRTTVDHPAGLTRLVVHSPALIAVTGSSGGGNGGGDGGDGGEEPGDFVEPDMPPAQVRPSQTVEYVYRPAGRFQFWTGSEVAGGGNPLVAGDEARLIASLSAAATDWDLTSFTSKLTVSVDGTTYDPYEQMFNQDPEASPGDLPIFWTQDLTAGTRDVVGEQLLPLMSDVPTAGMPNVRIRMSYTLVHDGLMIDYIIYNDDSVAHNIGLRVMIDALFGAAIRDGAAIVLDDGTVITNETKIPDPSNPGIAMPKTWVARDNANNPLVSLRGTLDGSEVRDAGVASESAGVPDEIAFGQFRNIGGTLQWDFQPNPRASLLGEDWAYAVKWFERTLQPGQSRRFVTYYGLGAAAVDYDPPYALAAYAPSALQVAEGDDPETPEIESYYLTDPDGNSVFEIVAMLDNFGTSPLTNATVRISLPEGLELYPDTQPRTVSMGLVNRNQSPLPMARWTVRAVATRPGTAEVSVTGPLGKVVRQQISIPAVPIIPARTSLLGLEMLSIPFEFTNSDASNVFGSLADSVFPGGPVAMWRWNPGSGQYLTYPDPFVANIEPGVGLWLLNQNRETIVLPAGATQVSQNVSFTLPLSPGWNQIGGPYAVPMRFDQVEVLDAQGSQWSIQEAAQRGLILPVLYSYDAENNEYEWSTSLQAARIIPFEGYWLLAFRDVALVFPPPSLSTLGAEMQVATAEAADEGWQVGLSVESAGRRCGERYLGVAQSASAGVDLHDVPAPPSALRPGPVVDAYFTIGDAGGPRYLVDTQPATAATKTWTLTVVAEEPGAAVTLRWPELSSTLPDGLVATLEDLDGGRQTYMRTSGSYTYNSGTGGARHFRVVVRERAGAALGLTATAQAASGRGLEILYTLSQSATVDVEVRNIAGRVVSRVASGREAEQGQNTLVWNGISDAGTAVPAGTYIVQVTARSAETGEQASVIRTATIGR